MGMLDAGRFSFSVFCVLPFRLLPSALLLLVSTAWPCQYEDLKSRRNMRQSAWMPRGWSETVMGVIWLPRMIDKARRRIEGELQRTDLLWPYMYGNNDYMDARLLRFLRLDDHEFLEIVRAGADDEGVAHELVRRSGVSLPELQEWGRMFGRKQRIFLLGLDADEDRRAPGLLTAVIKLAYNRLILPPAAWAYNRAERRRSASAPAAQADSRQIS